MSERQNSSTLGSSLLAQSSFYHPVLGVGPRQDGLKVEQEAHWAPGAQRELGKAAVGESFRLFPAQGTGRGCPLGRLSVGPQGDKALADVWVWAWHGLWSRSKCREWRAIEDLRIRSCVSGG